MWKPPSPAFTWSAVDLLFGLAWGGGGIFCWNNSNLTLVNVTVSGNNGAIGYWESIAAILAVNPKDEA